MPQIFHRSFNTISLVSIYGSVVILGGVGWALATFVRSSYATNVGVAHTQPIPFSHQHHVSELGIDCRYCHTSVEDSAFAGMPPTKTCINCHQQIWQGSPMLAPVRDSWRNDRSITWNRVHRVEEFCYFNHSIHVKKGIGCSSCHGQVQHMPLVWQQNTLLMEWCLECHRAPENHVRPRDEIYNMDWQPPTRQEELHQLGKKYNLDPLPDTPQELRQGLAKKYEIRSKLSCNACHR
jgi:hypothetical protein